MMLLLQVAMARERRANTRDAGEPARVTTVSPSHTPRTAARLWAATSRMPGVVSVVRVGSLRSWTPGAILRRQPDERGRRMQRCSCLPVPARAAPW